MGLYVCDICKHDFEKKQRLESHKARKYPCKPNLITHTTENTQGNEIVENQVKQTEDPIRYVDLFCGLGAFHTAFNTSTRFKCVLACDIDEGVRAIYEANYGLKPEGDIRKLNMDTLPDFEILCAGFPCQPFSIAGNGEGFKDTEKGNLFYDILKIMDRKKPPMCILENVKNLRTHENGETHKTIEQELAKRGYIVTSKVLNATEYGSPQARQRIFIVATQGKGFTIPPPTGIRNTVRSIIDSRVIANDLDPLKYTVKPKQQTGDATKPHCLYDVFPILSEAKQKRLLEAKKSIEPKGGRQGERVYSIDSVGVTICASSGGPGAKTGLYKVDNTIRRLTVQETLGMFGFPKDYTFLTTSAEDSLFYLGNSIVVNVPKAFVPALEEWFSDSPFL